MKKTLLFLFFIITNVSIFGEEIYLALIPQDNQVVIIDDHGAELSEVIKCDSNYIKNWRFDQGPLAIIKRDNKYCVINIDGEWVFSSDNKLMPAAEERLWEFIEKKDNKYYWRLIDLKGNEYTKTILNDPITPPFPFFNKYSVVENENKRYNIINHDGLLLTETNYFIDTIDIGINVELIDKNSLFVGNNMFGRWTPGWFETTIVDINGKEQFKPLFMSFPRPYNDGWFFAFVENRGGLLLNRAGESMFDDYTLSHASWFVDGLCPVLFKGENRKKFIDTEGNVVLDGYEIGFYDANPFNDGLACVAVNPPQNRNSMIRNNEHYGSREPNLWGSIDMHGNWVIEPKYPNSFWFNRELAEMTTTYSSKADYINEGYILESPRYTLINKKGEIVWDSLTHDIEVLKEYKEEITEIEFSLDHLELNTLEKINEYIMSD